MCVKGLGPNQAPDLGPNCLQKVISGQQKSPLAGKALKETVFVFSFNSSCFKYYSQLPIFVIYWFRSKLLIYFQYPLYPIHLDKQT